MSKLAKNNVLEAMQPIENNGGKAKKIKAGCQIDGQNKAPANRSPHQQPH
jgi:hypothetical protein